MRHTLQRQVNKPIAMFSMQHVFYLILLKIVIVVLYVNRKKKKIGGNENLQGNVALLNCCHQL